MDMNPKYYTEINPLDKIDDLKRRLAGYKIEVKNYEDKGFEWLEDYQDCLVVSNPFSDKTIEILFEEKVRRNGGSVRYTFWNPKDDVQIIIEKEKGSEKNG